MVAARLAERRPEIEQALSARVRALQQDDGDSTSRHGADERAAISAAIAYCLEVLQTEDSSWPTPIPLDSTRQACLAAREGVGLDTVLRRYVAGHWMLKNFVIEEMERIGGFTAADREEMRGIEHRALDRLVAAISEEYMKEARRQAESPEQRRAQKIRRLLDGESLLTAEFEYPFGGWHLAVIAVGAGTDTSLTDLATTLDRRLLVVRPDHETLWAWLGGRWRIDPLDLETAADGWPPGIRLAIGEPAQGLAGWRMTHRQANAAVPIARRASETMTRYHEVAVLAGILKDELLSHSLRQLFLIPLEGGQSRGATLRHTLRAYFAAGRNASSAAAALGVSRQAVRKRLETVEQRLGRPLESCGLELEAALRLDGFESS